MSFFFSFFIYEIEKQEGGIGPEGDQEVVVNISGKKSGREEV
jgi:hypothetical protein